MCCVCAGVHAHERTGIFSLFVLVHYLGGNECHNFFLLFTRNFIFTSSPCNIYQSMSRCICIHHRHALIAETGNIQVSLLSFFLIQPGWLTGAQGYRQMCLTRACGVYQSSRRCNCPSMTVACASGLGSPGIFLGHMTASLQSPLCLGRN